MLDNANFYKHKCKFEEPSLMPCNCDSDVPWQQYSAHSYFKRDYVFKTFEKIPVFAFSYVKGCHNDILFPSGYHLNSNFPNQTLNIPWEKKKFMANWAGALSEFYHKPKSMSSSTFSHRLRLIAACRKIHSCRAVATSYGIV
jgi:hypothetical protein